MFRGRKGSGLALRAQKWLMNGFRPRDRLRVDSRTPKKVRIGSRVSKMSGVVYKIVKSVAFWP